MGATPQRSSTALVVLSFPYSTDPPEFETDGLFYTLVDAEEGKLLPKSWFVGAGRISA